MQVGSKTGVVLADQAFPKRTFEFGKSRLEETKLVKRIEDAIARWRPGEQCPVSTPWLVDSAMM